VDDETARRLLKLQGLDSAIAALEIERDRSPILQELRSADENTARLRDTLRELQDEFESKRRDRAHLENELAGLEAKIETIEAQLYGGEIRASRELIGLQHELEHLRGERSTVESSLLEIMIEVEELSGVVGERQVELEGAERSLESLRARWESEARIFDERMAALQSERQKIAEEIDSELLDVYVRLQAHLDGVAVATLDGDRCTGCNVDLSKAALEEIARGEEELPKCEHCGRIILKVP
jgi:predicted  nucleic acid-binding Zn-ribbon protein